MPRHFLIINLLVCSLLAGCATPRASFARVDTLVAQRTGKKVHWNRDNAAEAQIAQTVHNFLQRELTANSAVEIALLNNRELQARFEEIGLAQADLIEAGQLTNPSFAASFRFPSRPPSGTNIEYSVAQNFLELLILPLRKRVAAAELAQTETTAANEVMKLAAEVKVAFYTVQARQQLRDRLRVIAETNEAAGEFSKGLHDAGNISDLDLANQQGSMQQSHLEMAQADLQLRHDRESLNRLLGLSGAEIGWTVGNHLPELPANENSLRHLETKALSQRLDLQALDMKLNLIGQALAFRTKTRFIPTKVSLGVDTEKDPAGQRVTGPTLDLELPIFNQGQGAIARLAAQYRQVRDQRDAAIVNAQSEVREAREQMLAARDLAFYIGKQLLPTQQKALHLTLQQYNYMLKSAYDLLLTKQNEVAAERSYIEAWRDYWIARAELERAVGGSFSFRGKDTETATHQH
ncbi:MAG: TolC family protein [Chthoniobacterales bacterium]|nr:TolC family protein [Chthoniobacterales bacterium]